MKEKKRYFWGFTLPVLIPFTAFVLIPILMSFYYSALDWNGISKSTDFIGIQNYIELFQDKNYLNSLFFTLKFAICNVILSNALAILFAVWVSGKARINNAMRICFFLPNVLCSLIVGFVWMFIFNQMTASLYQQTGWGIFTANWLSDPNLAFFALLIVCVWQGVGYYMVIYIAGLNNIDYSYREAAAIDGANRFQQFRHITLPLLMPSITVNLFMSIANSFRLFDLNLSLTDGGPGRATPSLALDIYTEAFDNSRMGYGSAKAVIFCLIVMAITFIQVGYTRKKEVEL